MQDILCLSQLTLIEHPLWPKLVLQKLFFLCLVVLVVSKLDSGAEEVEEFVHGNLARAILVHRIECLKHLLAGESVVQLAKALHKLLDVDFF